MFIKEKCKRCGTCLSGCPIIGMPVGRAKEEIEHMVDAGSSAVIDAGCARCGYCNEICPNGANPYDLIADMLMRKTAVKGARSLSLICRECSMNLMSIAMDFETEEKMRFIREIENPWASDTVFYLGCSLSCLHPDLAKTVLFRDLPKVGGMKYCCGNYVHTLFGSNESRIKGERLLSEFKTTGIRKLITFCPDCDAVMRSVYPRLVEGFDIEIRSISEFLLERHRTGELDFPIKIKNTVAFHDPCGWRRIGKEIYEAPRMLLGSMGATVVEMKHNRRQSLCCGTPLLSKNPLSAARLTDMRIAEAKEAGADCIAVACTGCFSLAEKALAHGLELYHITELAQIAIGEKPPHRIIEVMKRLMADVMKRTGENPDLINGRYLIQNGELRHFQA